MTTVRPGDLRLDVLPRATRRAFLYLTEHPLLPARQWYLAGGTALGLQVGHRQSVDLDFFTPRVSFRERLLERRLLATRQWGTSLQESGTIYGVFRGAKMSLIAYPFFRPSRDVVRCGHLRLLTPSDIAAMKIIAISQRGRKRDFVDLYWYCTNREPLDAVIRRALTQYPNQDHNVPHFLKSLTYFDDAERDPLPLLNFKASWKEIRQYFERDVPRVARDLLGLR